jgi:hypothetical protein
MLIINTLSSWSIIQFHRVRSGETLRWSLDQEIDFSHIQPMHDTSQRERRKKEKKRKKNGKKRKEREKMISCHATDGENNDDNDDGFAEDNNDNGGRDDDDDGNISLARNTTMTSGEARNFIEPGQNFDRKFTCDIIYK